MKNARQLCVLALVVCCVAPSFAQEAEKGKNKNKNKARGNPAINAAFAVRGVDLDEAQKEKVAALRKEHGPALEALAKKAGLTAERQKAIAEARKAAQAEGKKGKELRDAVEAAVTLSDEEKAAQKELQAKTAEVKKLVLALLTPEQKEKVGGGRAAGDKKPAGEKKPKAAGEKKPKAAEAE